MLVHRLGFLLIPQDCNYADIMPPTVAPEIFETTKMEGRWFQAIGNFFLSQVRMSTFDKRCRTERRCELVRPSAQHSRCPVTGMDAHIGCQLTKQANPNTQTFESIYCLITIHVHHSPTYSFCLGSPQFSAFDRHAKCVTLDWAVDVKTGDIETMGSKQDIETGNQPVYFASLR